MAHFNTKNIVKLVSPSPNSNRNRVMYKLLQRLAEVSANWSAQALHVEKDLDVSDV